MKTMMLSLLAATTALTLTAPASATVINFDDLPSNGGSQIANGYQGLNWNDVFVIAGADYGSGYQNGVVSPSNVALNGYATLATVSSATAFTLNSVYVTGAYQDENATFVGYNGSTQLFTTTFGVLLSGPTLHTFNWSGITSFTFVGSQDQLALDNLTINATPSVPEPASWAMMIVGVGAIGGTLRRRRKVTTRVSYAA